jgi:hypothetical protein
MPTPREPDLRRVRRKVQEALDMLHTENAPKWHPAFILATEVQRILAIAHDTLTKGLDPYAP